jgi:hypothetical protein
MNEMIEIQELETLEAPGFWSFVGGAAAGAGLVLAGYGVGVAIT